MAKEMIMAPVGSNHQAILAPAAEVKIPNLFEKERERGTVGSIHLTTLYIQIFKKESEKKSIILDLISSLENLPINKEIIPMIFKQDLNLRTILFQRITIKEQ